MQEGAKKGKRSRRSTEGDRVEAGIQNLHAMRAGVFFARLSPIAKIMLGVLGRRISRVFCLRTGHIA